MSVSKNKIPADLIARIREDRVTPQDMVTFLALGDLSDLTKAVGRFKALPAMAALPEMAAEAARAGEVYDFGALRCVDLAYVAAHVPELLGTGVLRLNTAPGMLFVLETLADDYTPEAAFCIFSADLPRDGFRTGDGLPDFAARLRLCIFNGEPALDIDWVSKIFLDARPPDHLLLSPAPAASQECDEDDGSCQGHEIAAGLAFSALVLKRSVLFQPPKPSPRGGRLRRPLGKGALRFAVIALAPDHVLGVV
jgi:hypothetical protein